MRLNTWRSGSSRCVQPRQAMPARTNISRPSPEIYLCRLMAFGGSFGHSLLEVVHPDRAPRRFAQQTQRVCQLGLSCTVFRQAFEITLAVHFNRCSAGHLVQLVKTRIQRRLTWVIGRHGRTDRAGDCGRFFAQQFAPCRNFGGRSGQDAFIRGQFGLTYTGLRDGTHTTIFFLT